MFKWEIYYILGTECTFLGLLCCCWCFYLYLANTLKNMGMTSVQNCYCGVKKYKKCIPYKIYILMLGLGVTFPPFFNQRTARGNISSSLILKRPECNAVTRNLTFELTQNATCCGRIIRTGFWDM